MIWIYKLYLWLTGWTVDTKVPPEAQKCVMVAAPHTSNWDFPYTMLAFRIMGIPQRFTIKKSWINSPLGWYIKFLGAVGIDRQKDANGEKISYTDQMAAIIQSHDRIAMAITPEGSRSPRSKWKAGFYYTALKAQVPICLGYVDYGRKHIGVGLCFKPSGNLYDDMQILRDFYATIKPKIPEKFKLDEHYLPSNDPSRSRTIL